MVPWPSSVLKCPGISDFYSYSGTLDRLREFLGWPQCDGGFGEGVSAGMCLDVLRWFEGDEPCVTWVSVWEFGCVSDHPRVQEKSKCTCPHDAGFNVVGADHYCLLFVITDGDVCFVYPESFCEIHWCCYQSKDVTD